MGGHETGKIIFEYLTLFSKRRHKLEETTLFINHFWRKHSLVKLTTRSHNNFGRIINISEPTNTTCPVSYTNIRRSNVQKSKTSQQSHHESHIIYEMTNNKRFTKKLKAYRLVMIKGIKYLYSVCKQKNKSRSFQAEI